MTSGPENLSDKEMSSVRSRRKVVSDYAARTDDDRLFHTRGVATEIEINY